MGVQVMARAGGIGVDRWRSWMLGGHVSHVRGLTSTGIASIKPTNTGIA